MAVTKFKTTSSFTNLTKYDSFLASNPAYIPSSFESIATVTVGSGGSSTITFSSIPQTYTHLQLRIFGTNSSGDAILRFNGDTTNSNYSAHQFYANGSSVSSDWPPNTSYPPYIDVGAGSGANFAEIIDIFDYTNNNKYKTTRIQNGWDNNGTGRIGLFSHLWMNTSAITTLVVSGRTWSNATFALFGIKGA